MGTQRRYRVAHVITRLCKGGAQENTFHTVRLANRERFDVDLISGPLTGDEGSLEEEVERAGIPIVREPDLTRAVSPWRDFRALRSLTRRLRDGHYDIVHTHTSKAGFIGRLAAHRAKVPVIVHTPHGNVFHGYFGHFPTRLFVWMERYAARYSDRIIELTRRGIEESLAEGIGRDEHYVSIFSGIDLGPFDEAIANRDETRQVLGVGDDEVLIGGVGRLEPIKGFTYFIEAAKAVARRSPTARFVVVGTGSLDTTLRDQAKELGDRCAFLGLRRDVPRLMAAMDVLVVPSLNEGMGRVILEAGAAGVPVIASDVGGIPEVVEDGRTGTLVPPESAESLAEVIAALVEDPERRARMGQAARERVVPHYGLDTMVRQIETLYEQLLKEKAVDA